ncbi:hypothetical protein NQZ68_013233 [Dissostichus eleginoides]|nr:hypothetical protein NQZ68_013233 [Dissostichus eleginoides]
MLHKRIQRTSGGFLRQDEYLPTLPKLFKSAVFLRVATGFTGTQGSSGRGVSPPEQTIGRLRRAGRV